jgi:hypothetical protein
MGIKTLFIWVPESSNQKRCYASSSLLSVFKTVIKPTNFTNNLFPSGRIFFAGNPPSTLDENLLFQTVMNNNLTDYGLNSFLHQNNIAEFDYIRFPGRGNIICKPWSENLPTWIFSNMQSFRPTPNEMNTPIFNLSNSLRSNSNPNVPYHVTEDGHALPTMVHLIPDEIPDSVEVIRQGDLYWHRLHTEWDDMPPLTNIFSTPPRQIQQPAVAPPPAPSRKRPLEETNRFLLSVELPDNKSLMLYTTCNAVAQFLATEYLISVYLFPLISSTDRLLLLNRRRQYLESLSINDLKTQYTNYMNYAKSIYRNYYDLSGRLYFMETARIINMVDDSLILAL